MKEITIKLSEPVAEVYRNADQTEQQWLEQMVNELMEYILRKKVTHDFLTARQALSDEARANGFTDEQLESILRED